MKLSDKLIAAILTVVLGVLFIALKGGVIGIAMTVLGIALIVWSVFDFMKNDLTLAIVKLIAGVVVIVFGWTLASIALYVMAALLLVYGVYHLYQLIKARNSVSDWQFVEPAICAVIGILLLFNQGGTIDWVFIVSGIFLIIQGILNLICCVDNGKK